MSIEPPKKKRKVSKNKKKSWRKHCDITEIEEFLEDERLQERTGGKVSIKSNEELFFVDSKADSKSSAVHGKRKWQAEPMRSYANLTESSSTKPITEAKKIKQKKATRSHQGSQKKTKCVSNNQKDAAAFYNLWDTKSVDDSTDKVQPAIKVTAKIPAKKIPSQLPAIELAHPGQSYNPALSDYVDLIKTAAQEAEKQQKEERRIARALDEKFPKASKAPTEESWLKEMSAGLFDQQDSDKDEDENEDSEEHLPNLAVRRENQKTEKQKLKEKLQKNEEKKKALEKEKRIRNNEIFRLKKIKAEIAREEQKQAEKLEKKLKMEEEKKVLPKKLGRQKYENPSLEVKLIDELEGSLRKLRPEGNVLEDRFHSLQKRNIIEPRKRARFVRHYTPKSFEKKGHKEVTS